MPPKNPSTMVIPGDDDDAGVTGQQAAGVTGQQAAGVADVNQGLNNGQGSTPDPVQPQTKAVGLPATTRIILEENDNIPPTGQFFGFNGRNFMLRPGEVANVPQGIIDILDNAVQKQPMKDPTTLKVMGYRDKLRFPYRVVRT